MGYLRSAFGGTRGCGTCFGDRRRALRGVRAGPRGGPADDRGARPPGVRRRVNFADPGDVAAVPRDGIGRMFDGVDVDEHTLTGAFAFHKAANHLSHKRLATLLAHGTGS